MKKIIAIALIAVMMLGLAACGTINKTDVAVLWSGDGKVKVPNSLINALERAMYIENIAYAHHGANGEQATQTQQAEEALNAGCAALLVELVDDNAAQTIVDMAKAKNVPVVFFGCTVADGVLDSYEKCAWVTVDGTTAADTFSAMVLEYVEGNELDLDGDGKIQYLPLGNIRFNGNDTLVSVTGELADLSVETVSVEKSGLFGTSTEEYGRLKTKDGKLVELILTGDDTLALQTLVKLQELGLNTDKLSTHFVPVFTVGADADYKGYVLENKPEEGGEAYLEQMKHLVDLTAVDEEDMPNMIFNTLDQVGTGKLCGTMMENYDAIAEAAAKVLAELLKGETVEQSVVKVAYTTYEG